MAKKQRNKDEERGVDIDHLEPALRNQANYLGFHKRLSINKLLRAQAHERFVWVMSWAFTVATGGVAILCLVLRFVLPPDKQGHCVLIGLFAAFWALGSWAYARRARRLGHAADQLLAVVKAKLGKD